VTWVLGARDQVAAKFGKNSDPYAATGLKKKSEHKKGGRVIRGWPMQRAGQLDLGGIGVW
jgi:hypothetical protein